MDDVWWHNYRIASVRACWHTPVCVCMLLVCKCVCMRWKVGMCHACFCLLHRTDIHIFNMQTSIKEFVSNVKIYYL